MFKLRNFGLGFVMVLGGLLSVDVIAADSDSSDIAQVLRQTRWVDFAPTGYDPEAVPASRPTGESIRTDLRFLRRAGFDGVITYGQDLPSITELAVAEGFLAILIGIWDPSSQSEISLAVIAAKNPAVKGIIVGNEVLTFRRSTPDVLRRAMEQVRRETGKPVSTTEIIEAFYSNQDLIGWSDFITVNAHAYFHGHRDPVRAVDWTLGAWDRLARLEDKPTLFKEIGLPTNGGVENSEQNQREFYFRMLTTTTVQFAFFEGYDQPWKTGPVEESWGLFRADRSPKPAGMVLLDPESCLGAVQRSWCQR